MSETNKSAADSSANNINTVPPVSLDCTKATIGVWLVKVH